MSTDEFMEKIDDMAQSDFIKESMTRRYMKDQEFMTTFSRLLVELGLTEWSNFKPGAYFILAVGGKEREMKTEAAVDYSGANRAEIEAYIKGLLEAADEASDYLLRSIIN